MPCPTADDSSCSIVEPDSSTFLQSKAGVILHGSREEEKRVAKVDGSDAPAWIPMLIVLGTAGWSCDDVCEQSGVIAIYHACPQGMKQP
jgi:hypothetical protein